MAANRDGVISKHCIRTPAWEGVGFDRHFPYGLRPTTPPESNASNIVPSPEIPSPVGSIPRRRRENGAAKALRVHNKPLRSELGEIDSTVVSLFMRLFAGLPDHDGAALGCMAAKRRIRSRIVRYSRRGMATSASWKVTYRAWHTIFAPILINLSRSVVRV